MHENVGRTDAWIRGALGILLLIAAAVLNHTPVASLIAAFLGLVFLGTALTRSCPLYRLLGVDTSARDRRHQT